MRKRTKGQICHYDTLGYPVVCEVEWLWQSAGRGGCAGVRPDPRGLPAESGVDGPGECKVGGSSVVPDVDIRYRGTMAEKKHKGRPPKFD